MENNAKCIYLMSSNASKEYLLDVLETLTLPFGAVQHFRYQLRWLDDDLKKKLPKKDEDKENELRNSKIVTCYLYQEKEKTKWQWVAIYPIRTGILMDAYKTGETAEDVAHFYYKVENYIYCDNQDSTEMLREIAGARFDNKYAFLDSPINNRYITNKEERRSAFHRICESLKWDHFKSPEGKEYYPLFCFIDGLKDEDGKAIVPKYHSLSHKSFYELVEGNFYSFAFMTYSPKKPPQFIIKLISDEKIFSTPHYELTGASRYDEESWTIIPSLLEKEIWSTFSFKTELNAKDIVNGKEPLNLYMNFPVKVKRKMRYRVIDFLSDFGFGIGTGAIALSKLLENKWIWWYWPVIGGYTL